MEHEKLSRTLAEIIKDHSRLKQAMDRLLSYAEMIFQANSRFNLTGCKDVNSIIESLITESLTPFTGSDVPRGTYFIDAGCGAGIPGIPIAVVFPVIRGVLLDSSSKKTAFVNDVIRDIGLKGVETLTARAEEAAYDGRYAEAFDFAFTRAAGSPYVTAELCCRFVKTGGYIYHYSSGGLESHPPETAEHIKKLGLSAAGEADRRETGISGGILLKKVLEPERVYPRRYAVIKRSSDRIYGD